MSNEEMNPLARSTDLVTKEVGDEVLVYDLTAHKAHCLNQMAALVWKLCDGNHSVADIAQLLTQEHLLVVDEAAVWLAVAYLSKAGLLEHRVAAPARRPRLGRREVMRRIGTGVGVPLVTSIVAPTALAGCTGKRLNNQSCTNNTQCCSGCCDVGGNPSNVCRNPGSQTIPTGGAVDNCNNGTNNRCCTWKCIPNPTGPGYVCT